MKIQDFHIMKEYKLGDEWEIVLRNQIYSIYIVVKAHKGQDDHYYLISAHSHTDIAISRGEKPNELRGYELLMNIQKSINRQKIRRLLK
jgi:hypothetical protein